MLRLLADTSVGTADRICTAAAEFAPGKTEGPGRASSSLFGEGNSTDCECCTLWLVRLCMKPLLLGMESCKLLKCDADVGVRVLTLDVLLIQDALRLSLLLLEFELNPPLEGDTRPDEPFGAP